MDTILMDVMNVKLDFIIGNPYVILLDELKYL